MNRINIDKLYKNGYVQFVKKYILQSDSLLIPFFYTEELNVWGSQYNLNVCDFEEQLPWKFGQEEFGMRYAVIQIDYVKMKNIFLKFNCMEEMLNMYNLFGMATFMKGKLVTEIVREGVVFLNVPSDVG